MSDEEALIDGALLLRGEEGPRVLRAWSVMIGLDQIEQLNDLAKEARDRGWEPQASAWALLRAAIDEWIPAEHRRRAERDERERNSQATKIEEKIEALMVQLRALRDGAAAVTAPVATGVPHQPPLPLPSKRSRPAGSVRQHATRDVLAALRGRGWTYEAEIARMVYGSPGARNEARARKRLRALQHEGRVECRQTETADGHGFPWRLK
jgi:hypothetical protein